LLGVYLLLQRTTVGLTMRAAAHHPEASRLLGVQVSWMLALGWGLASAVGAVSGIMVAPILLLEPNMMQSIIIYAFAAAVLGGISGELSLGHGAFMALGAYMSAILAHRYKMDYLLTIPIATLFTGLVGFLFGFPALRLSPLYLALATFALAVVTPSLIKRPEGLTGGVQGIILIQPDPPPFASDLFAAVTGTAMTSDQWIYYVSLFCALLLFWVAW